MNNEYNNWMNSIQSEVLIKLSPSEAKVREIMSKVDPKSDYELWRSMIDAAYTVYPYKNISLLEAQKIAEPIRIANPSQHVSIYAGKSFIGNTTWNDQMKMFWEYPTFTEEGAKLAGERKAECDLLGKVASWE